ncbi:hypothetical protein GLOTRDRAFT_27069, partial [Gloeophyllum trabeum ATCC 11539]
LTLDMPVHWSSTNLMLHLAVNLRKAVDQFVQEIIWVEANAAKSAKLHHLCLSDAEWLRVRKFLELLQVPDLAQQSFSSDCFPALHIALPALEALHAVWSRCLTEAHYQPFHSALEKALDTVKEYYDLTADSDAYIIAMVLDPLEKLSQIKQTWPEVLYAEVFVSAKRIFKERYLQMYPSGVITTVKKSNKNQKLRHLLSLGDMASLSSSPSTSPAPNPTSAPDTSASPTPPWEQAFNKYLDGEDEITEDTTITTWWGLNQARYPVWASLARNYLPVMASSVSSEWAFSGAGITLTKRRNRLKADIVEVLQGLKCAMRHDLLIRPSGPTLALEEELLAEADQEDKLIDSIPPSATDSGFTMELDLDSDAE